jgi:biotin carboxylase
MAKLLFLGASVSQCPAIRRARELGHAVVACDADPKAVGFAQCDTHEVLDFSDVDAVTAVAARERVDGVLAVCTDRAVVPAATVAARLGLPGIGIDVARAMTHKPTMRGRLREWNVTQPAYVVLTRESDGTLANAVSLPAVVKPADSGGQRGLYLVERRRQLPACLAAALLVSRSGQAMLEEYVDGHELNLLFAVRRGVPRLLTVSDRLRPPGDGFGVGWIHSFPSALPEEMLREAEAVASTAIRCLGLRDGIAFPQVIVAGRRAVLVEVAARVAAGQMADLLRHATGIDIYEVAIAQALGLGVPDALVMPRFTRPVAIRFLTASPGLLPTGRVVSIGGLEQVRASEGVLDADLYFGVGAEIGPLRVDADRRGYVIATGATAEDALARATRAAGRLTIATELPRVVRSEGSVRLLAAALLAGLLVASAAGFGLTERAKLRQALVTATRVSATFSPTCGCRRDVAHVTFRLLRRARTVVDVVNRSGAPVAALSSARTRGPGTLRLAWSGHGTNGRREPDGRYFAEVVFPQLHRSLRLPSPIALDSDAPAIDRATVTIGRRLLVVRYRFGEQARAALYAGGRRVVLTRFTPRRGTIRLRRRTFAGRRLRLIAIDPAGNRSQRSLGVA